jgi:hypothetical protein
VSLKIEIVNFRENILITHIIHFMKLKSFTHFWMQPNERLAFPEIVWCWSSNLFLAKYDITNTSASFLEDFSFPIMMIGVLLAIIAFREAMKAVEKMIELTGKLMKMAIYLGIFLLLVAIYFAPETMGNLLRFLFVGLGAFFNFLASIFN